MSRELLRLTASLYNTPHLIDEHAISGILEYLQSRNIGEAELASYGSNTKSKRVPQYNSESKVGVVPVDGPLTYVAYSGMCGEEGCSYQQIKEDFDILVEQGAKTILLDVSGPGGQAYGMQETGTYLRNTADEKGIKLLTYIDVAAYSASYGIAACAHEVIINPEAAAGSIGVLVKLRDTSEAMKRMGVKDTYISAGKEKIPFDEDGKFTKEFINDLQEKVDKLYTNFTRYVAEMRGISVDTVRNTEAKTFTAEDVVQLGLADQLMSREEFFNYLADVVEGTVKSESPMLKNSKLFGGQPKASSKLEQENMEQLEQLQASLDAKASELETALASLATLTAAQEAATLEVATLTTKLADATSVVTELQAWKQEKLSLDAQTKLTARKAAIAECVQEDQRESLFTSTESLSDEAFNTVLSALGAKAKAEQTSTEFNEVGVISDTEATVVDGTTRLIKKLYK